MAVFRRHRVVGGILLIDEFGNLEYKTIGCADGITGGARKPTRVNGARGYWMSYGPHWRQSRRRAQSACPRMRTGAYGTSERLRFLLDGVSVACDNGWYERGDMSMHTKGPWTMIEDTTHVTIRDAGGCSIYHEIKRLDGARDVGCLIAAAPDLLEALEIALEVMEIVDGENDCSRGICAAERAIAKARGANIDGEANP